MGGIMLLVSFIQVVLLTVAVWYGSEVAMAFGRDIRRDRFDRVVNLSSVALLWIGADRIEDGSTQIGSLAAYLAYLLQILLAVTMAAFMVSMIPRAVVAAERIVEVLDTESLVRPPPTRSGTSPGRGRWSSKRSASDIRLFALKLGPG